MEQDFDAGLDDSEEECEEDDGGGLIVVDEQGYVHCLWCNNTGITDDRSECDVCDFWDENDEYDDWEP